MILCIVGPTGVGKTKLSIELAKKYDAIIINADAMQIYKGMDIGTAKIKEEEQEGIPHYLFSIKDVSEDYTVFDYQKDARDLIDKFRNRNIIFVGGSGLYLKAALYNYVFREEGPSNPIYETMTNQELYDLALEKDMDLDIHVNNRNRLIRFLNREDRVEEDCYLMYKATFIGLTTDRETLYARINDRVDKMFQSGLVAEVKKFYDSNVKSRALSTAIGYKELYKYLDMELYLTEAKDLIKKNSRHYAKRQYTWFNNQMDVKWFDVNFKDFNKTTKEVEEYIEGLGK